MSGTAPVPALSDEQRKKLKNAVEQARVIAEKGAREALDELGVADPKPAAHLDEPRRVLRRQLRAHARQLGDARGADDRQDVTRLAQECAYAHWHRMLFARFLAENNALMVEDDGQSFPVSLDELDEWATEWKCSSRWEAAARCAVKLLPQIFGSHDRVLALPIPANRQRALEDELGKLPGDTFRTRDALGWVYQFWQSAAKDRINAGGDKIGADELPAVTQLFTEPYMVDFLLQNTLGAWWYGRHGRDAIVAEMEYLRFLDDGTPAAGSFADWPTDAAKLKLLDPCCGSGHFLVAAFELLVKFRIAEEGLALGTAIDAVLMQNLYGLELDPRCVQIAAFAVALRGWMMLGSWRQLYGVQVACVGLGIRATKQQWVALAEGNEKCERGLERLYDDFSKAPVLGSLIEPAKRTSLLEASFEDLQPLLAEALRREAPDDDEHHELAITAAGVVRAAELLAGRYHLVCTNPPYLAFGKQCDDLKQFSEHSHKNAKADIATTFLSRAVQWLVPSGDVAMVLPQNWLFLNGYKRFRQELLTKRSPRVLVRLGAGAFTMISGEVVKAVLYLDRSKKADEYQFHGIDVASFPDAATKSLAIRSASLSVADQPLRPSNPDARLSVGESTSVHTLQNVAWAFSGQRTGDADRFIAKFWEVELREESWVRHSTTTKTNVLCGGNELALLWEQGQGQLARYQRAVAAASYSSGGWKQGWQAWGTMGVRVSQTGKLYATIHTGSHFDNNTAVIVPTDKNDLAAIWAFCSSPEFARSVREIDQSLKVTNATLVKVPFDLDHWTKKAAEKYPDGLPEAHSDDPTQWLFRGDILTATRPLQVAVARLVGYRWPDQAPDEALDVLADNDGIVCLPAVRTERAAAERLLEFLARAYGDTWTAETLSTLLAQENGAGLTLEQWLRDRCFEQHSQFFQYRPFIWHVWDGLKDGFSALLHYHRLGHDLLERLIHSELGSWIDQQQRGVQEKIAGAAERLVAAKALQSKLKEISIGEAPHDLFVRWKTMKAQPLGWDPDINDGVRINIRPFVQAGVLRKAPKNITWDKADGGKDPPGSPWYELTQGVRMNNRHTTLAEKRAARTAKPVAE